MQRNKCVLIYGAVVILLFAHLAIAWLFSEPYPSLVFPSFSHAEPGKKVYRFSVFNLYGVDEQGTQTLLKKNAELTKAFLVHPEKVLKIICLKEKKVNKAAGLEAAFAAKGSGATVPTADAAARARFILAIKENLKSLYPQKKFTGLLVVTSKVSYNTVDKTITQTPVANKTIRIAL